MNRTYGDVHYESNFIEHIQDGYGGYELHKTHAGKRTRVATVIFWDAMGQYYVETFGDVALVVLEELVRETKAHIGIAASGPFIK